MRMLCEPAGMMILHPDLLLSGTRITGSLKCKRQAVLEERFAGSSNDKAVMGTLMHEVFQVRHLLSASLNVCRLSACALGLSSGAVC